MRHQSFSPRAIAAAVIVVSLAGGATLAAADPEHERLARMCGSWDVDATFWLRPGGPGVTTKATAAIRPLFDGLFVEETIQGMLNGTPFTTMAWTGFNPETHQYEATRIASTNAARIAESGTYDEATKRFELRAEYPLAGSTWSQRTVIEQASTDAMVATSFLSFGNVPEWKTVEIRYTRRK